MARLGAEIAQTLEQLRYTHGRAGIGRQGGFANAVWKGLILTQASPPRTARKIFPTMPGMPVAMKETHPQRGAWAPPRCTPAQRLRRAGGSGAEGAIGMHLA
jgi:hypothetical protein